jgi:hypothetical protein
LNNKWLTKSTCRDSLSTENGEVRNKRSCKNFMFDISALKRSAASVCKRVLEHWPGSTVALTVWKRKEHGRRMLKLVSG